MVVPASVCQASVQAGVVADRDRRRFCCWRGEDRDDEVKPERGCNVDVGADRDRGVACLDPVQCDARNASGFGTGDYGDTEGLSAFAQPAHLGARGPPVA